MKPAVTKLGLRIFRCSGSLKGPSTLGRLNPTPLSLFAHELLRYR